MSELEKGNDISKRDYLARFVSVSVRLKRMSGFCENLTEPPSPNMLSIPENTVPTMLSMNRAMVTQYNQAVILSKTLE